MTASPVTPPRATADAEAPASGPPTRRRRHRRRLPASGTLVAVAVVLVGIVFTMGWVTRVDDRCAANAVDDARYEGARFDGWVRWEWWPPGFRTLCRATAPDGREIPYEPVKGR